MFSKVSAIVISIMLSACASAPKVAESVPTFHSSEEAQSYLKQFKKCPGCNLKKAELAYADLRNADLRGANLKGADLNHADLRGADLRGATLVRADLSTATLLSGADLRDANMTEANIEPKELAQSHTCGATLPNGTKAPQCNTADVK